MPEEIKLNNDRRFDIDLKKGQVAEQQLADILGDTKIEVKRDEKVSYTNNLAVEFMARGNPSGISTSEADWWTFVLSGDGYHDEVVVMIRKKRLERLLVGARTCRGGDKDGGKIGVGEFFLLPLVRLLDKLKGVSY